MFVSYIYHKGISPHHKIASHNSNTPQCIHYPSSSQNNMKDKQKRVDSFSKELRSLCNKYEVELLPVINMIPKEDLQAVGQKVSKDK